MSFQEEILAAIKSIQSAVGKSITLKGSDIKNVCDSNTRILHVLTIAAINVAGSKITQSIGSTNLRKLIKALNDGTDVSFSNDDLSKIAYEVNYLCKQSKTSQNDASNTVLSSSSNWIQFPPILEGFSWGDGVGPRHTGVPGASSNHKGVDLRLPSGNLVYSVGKGVVSHAGWQDSSNHKKGFGLYVEITHGNGYVTRYGHLSEVRVTLNQQVVPGSAIGLSGSTGTSSGPHVHFEMRKDGKVLDPKLYLAKFERGASDSKKVVKVSSKQLASDWADVILAEVKSRGNARVRACFPDTDGIIDLLTIEGAVNVSDGTMRLALINGSYCGPFQCDINAWASGPAKFSRLKLTTTEQLRSATANMLKGGPTDLAVMGPGIVEFWNTTWREFDSLSKSGYRDRTGKVIYKRRSPAEIAAVPTTAQMMYMLHNQGQGGCQVIYDRQNPATRLIRGKAQKQSTMAVAVGNVVVQ